MEQSVDIPHIWWALIYQWMWWKSKQVKSIHAISEKLAFMKNSHFCVSRCSHNKVLFKVSTNFPLSRSSLKDIIWVLQKKKCKSTHVGMAEEWKQERIWNVIISTLFLDFVSHPGFSSIENCFKNCSRQLAQKSCFQICS